jgi:uncharacterized heparinase superfamily protein
VEPAARYPSQTAPNQFRFLNEDGGLSRGWDDPGQEKLWRYNLHYFDDLNAIRWADRDFWHESLILRWVSENPPAYGTGWEPYPTSLRLVNWIKWALAGNRLPAGAVQSLAVQARWLSRRLEYHLLGNHLFANAKALVFAGSFFSGEEASGWLRTGERIIEKQISEQILSDGGHFELSTMYHSLALEDVLDLVNLSRAFPEALGTERELVGALESKVIPMCSWLAAMCHPDGEISFFNDAAVGVAPSPKKLTDYSARLGFDTLQPNKETLASSGYVRLEAGPSVLMFDAARIGPDYLPGHAHADTLSIEVSIYDRRFLVNSGTSTYGIGPERLRQRGTPAHNTVTVEGENSSEVWAGFRVARRARPFGFKLDRDGDSARLECAHDGYARLRKRPIHRRKIELRPDRLEVEDFVTGKHHPAEARFHFHPDWTISAAANGLSGTAHSSMRHAVSWKIAIGRGRLESSSFHPEFGLSIASTCLAVTLANGESRVQFFW